MTMRTPANSNLSVSRGLPGAVLHDISTGAWIIDVSDAGPNLDRSLIEPERDMVLVCFGAHAIGDCPLDAPIRMSMAFSSRRTDTPPVTASSVDSQNWLKPIYQSE